MTTLRTILFFAVFLLAVANANATPAWRPPLPCGPCYSANLRFMLEVANGDNGICAVFATDNNAVPLWTFKPNLGYGTRLLVSNDGQTVADLTLPTTAFKVVDRVDDANATCLRLWGPAGLLKTYRLRDLCMDVTGIGHTRRGGLFSSGWREWFLEVAQEEDSFRVLTIDGAAYRFSFQNGTILDYQSPEQILQRQVFLFLAFAATIIFVPLIVTLRFDRRSPPRK